MSALKGSYIVKLVGELTFENFLCLSSTHSKQFSLSSSKVRRAMLAVRSVC